MRRPWRLVFALFFATAATTLHSAEHLNMRGVMCEPIDFAELDTFNKREIEVLFCSYSRGHHIANKTLSEQADKYKGTRTEVAILQEGIRAMEKCSRPMMRIADLYKRKFEGAGQIKCEPPPQETKPKATNDW